MLHRPRACAPRSHGARDDAAAPSRRRTGAGAPRNRIAIVSFPRVASGSFVSDARASAASSAMRLARPMLGDATLGASRAGAVMIRVNDVVSSSWTQGKTTARSARRSKGPGTCSGGTGPFRSSSRSSVCAGPPWRGDARTSSSRGRSWRGSGFSSPSSSSCETAFLGQCQCGSARPTRRSGSLLGCASPATTLPSCDFPSVREAMCYLRVAFAEHVVRSARLSPAPARRRSCWRASPRARPARARSAAPSPARPRDRERPIPGFAREGLRRTRHCSERYGDRRS